MNRSIRPGTVGTLHPWTSAKRSSFSTMPPREDVSRVVRPIVATLRTHAPAARIREVRYRGEVTATMQYDALPINDHFRMLDAGTLIGAMDYRKTRSRSCSHSSASPTPRRSTDVCPGHRRRKRHRRASSRTAAGARLRRLRHRHPRPRTLVRHPQNPDSGKRLSTISRSPTSTSSSTVPASCPGGVSAKSPPLMR